jgi:undecaprenyl-diphosphatase
VRDARAQAFVGKVLLAFLPAAVVGLLLHKWIVRALFGPLPVAVGLAVGGVLLLAIDRPNRAAPRTFDIDAVTWAQALLLAARRVASLWPGVSRSARPSSARCSWAWCAARPRVLVLSGDPDAGCSVGVCAPRSPPHVGRCDLPIFALGLVTSFLVSLAVIAVLLRYVRDHDLRVFGWYRLALAALIVLLVGR